MSQKLASLQSHLSALSGRRWLARLLHGSMALALVLAFALVVAFAFDWTFRFSRDLRIVVLAVFGAIAVWSFGRYVWPALFSWESIIDLALKVERRQKIDSDLVAALQFESTAQTWGSPQLTTAVVDRVAVSSRTLPLGEGLAEVSLIRRALPLALVIASLAYVSLAFPAYSSAFWNRLFLGGAHYPTRTNIVRVSINEVEAFPALPAGADVKVPFGTNLQFAVDAAGELPSAGSIQLTALDGTAATTLALTSNDGAPGKYTAELGRAPENLTYKIMLGDAWSVPGTIVVIQPPVVAMDLEHTPPAYAANPRLSRGSTGSRQIAVMEGSKVSVSVRCTNKPLAKCELVIGDARFALEPADGEKRKWKTPVGTPFDEMTSATAFTVDTVDIDGLIPEEPLQGQIHIQVDRSPRIAGAVVTEKVLPNARPSIVWGAVDDNGIAEIRLVKQVTRTTGETSEASEIVKKVSPQEQPQPTLRGKHLIDLKSLNLVKGDEVRVTLDAVDYRGSRPGAVAQSEPLIFTVTDESGILAGLVEADEKSARQLDQIIQRQLGIGENR
jgi:hypothetical protein